MDYEEMQHQLTELEEELKDIKDVDVLLERILTGARNFVNADAGSIYEFDAQSDLLSIRYSQNNTLQQRLNPGEKLPYISFSMHPTAQSIAGYCVISKKVLNIEDVYNLPDYIDFSKNIKRPYNFNSDNDKKNDYHTISMLTLPLIKITGEILGVLQIINPIDKQTNKVIAFDTDSEFWLTQLAGKVSSILSESYSTREWINRLLKLAELRDPRETGAHVDRVSRFSLEIYDRYAANKNIPVKEQEIFRDYLSLAARCHDVGKVGISDKILKKRGILEQDERDVMKGHTCIGAQIFSPQKNPLDVMAKNICLHHHDRWDGGPQGYPGNFNYMSYVPDTKMPHEIEQELKGNDIPLEARIVALADVYDALRHKRCYKNEWTAEQTFNEIKKQRAHQFDPELVDVFFQIKDRLEDINESIT